MSQCSSCSRVFHVSASFRGKDPKCNFCRGKPVPEVLIDDEPVDQEERLRKMELLKAVFKVVQIEAKGLHVLQFLEHKYRPRPGSEIPDAIPKHLRTEWEYSLTRSWGKSFRAILLLLIYVGFGDRVAENDIMAGKGFFDFPDDLPDVRREFGFYEK